MENSLYVFLLSLNWAVVMSVSTVMLVSVLCVCWNFLLSIFAAVEFLNKVAAAEDQHAQQLMNIVKNYRKKTSDNLKKDPWVCTVACVCAFNFNYEFLSTNSGQLVLYD